MEYKLFRSKRKTVSVQINKYGEIIVRAPLKYPETKVEEFLQKHKNWITEHQNKVHNNPDFTVYINDGLMKELKQKLSLIIPEKVNRYSKIMGLYPKSVKITSAKTRFGSCSGKNAVCFSGMLALFPDEAIDYVVVHELAHIKYHNHGKDFYKLVETYLPDYNKRRALLKQNPFNNVDNKNNM